MKRIEILWKLLNGFGIQHIGRSQNMHADSLSKKRYASRTWEIVPGNQWGKQHLCHGGLLFPGL